MNLPKRGFRTQWIILIIFSGIVLSLYLVGCTSKTQSAEFPIGLFDCVECQGFTERYLDDGTLIVYMHGNQFITGKWYVEGDVFYTGDGFCNDKDAMPASYKWNFDGMILTFKAIKDDCSDRVSSLDGKPWRLIEEK